MINPIPELESVRFVIDKWARPAIWISAGEHGHGAVGCSRIGATPDLPPSVNWPSRPGSDGTLVPFEYVLQINLAELPEADTPQLPEHGMLWLFEVWNSPDDHEQLIVYTGDERLAPADLPAGEQYYADHVSPHTLTFRAGFDIPRWTSDADDEFRAELTQALYGIEAIDDDVADTLDELIARQRRTLSDGAFAWLFGYAGGIGHPIHEDAAVHRADPTAFYDWAKRAEMDLSDAASWRNLLTVESDSSLGLVIGDAGYTVAMIHEDDLAAQDFSRVYLTNESS